MYKLVNMGRLRLLNVLAEAALIIFSILVALFTNRWRDEHAAHLRVARDLAAIRVEVLQNRAILADVLPYHRQEVTDFGKFLERTDLEQRLRGQDMVEAVRANREELQWHGVWNPHVTPSSLSDTAWKTAVANGDLQFMSPDIAKALTDYYSYQGVPVVSTINLIGQIYMSPPTYDRAQTVTMLRTLQGTFDQLADQETSLLQQADKTLQALPER